MDKKDNALQILIIMVIVALLILGVECFDITLAPRYP